MSNLPTTIYNKYYDVLKHNDNSYLKEVDDFPEIFADINVRHMFGSSFIFSTLDEDLLNFWNDLIIKSRLYVIITKMIRSMSLYGSIVLGFQQFAGKEHEDCKGFRLYINDPTMLTQKVYLGEKLVGCSFIVKKNHRVINNTPVPHYILETWNKKQVSRKFFGESKNEIQLMDLVIKFPELKNMKILENNPFTNLNTGESIFPFQDFNNNSHNSFPDWYLARGAIKDYVDFTKYDITERWKSQTRIIINTKTANDSKTIEEKLNLKKRMGDLIINLDLNNDALSINDFMTIIKGDYNPLLSEETSLKKLIKLYDRVGLSYQAGEASGSATEVIYNTSNQTKNFMRKRRYFEDNMNLLLRDLFIAAGFNEDNLDFSFTLERNEALSELQRLEIVKTKEENGWITREMAVSQGGGHAMEDVPEIIKKLDEDDKKNEDDLFNKELALAKINNQNNQDDENDSIPDNKEKLKDIKDKTKDDRYNKNVSLNIEKNKLVKKEKK